SQKTG
ncbi:hypothetical protein A2U01_0111415, partial [Trifolium medium]